MFSSHAQCCTECETQTLVNRVNKNIYMEKKSVIRLDLLLLKTEFKICDTATIEVSEPYSEYKIVFY